jgi:hypothetical protein
LSQFANQTCADFAKGTDFTCAGGIKGLVATGDACAQDIECTTGYCNQPMAGDGTCAAVPGEGAPCNDECSGGFYCEAGTCTAQKPLGSACTLDSSCTEGRCVGSPGAETCALVCDGK